MNIFKNKTILYAMSLAASWAWGVSLVVGMQTIQTKGIIPFSIWAIANSMALPLFGLIAFRIKRLKDVISTKLVCLINTIIMIFCLWIQMNAIYQYVCTLPHTNETFVRIITIVIALIMAVILFRDGLVKSIYTDNILWYICYGVLIILFIVACATKVECYDITLVSNEKEIRWALKSCLILFSGPIMNIQNWQMADKLNKEKKMKAHYLAGVLFAVYMIFVSMLAQFKFSGLMNIFLVIIVLCVALSTMDSAIVAMQKIAGKKVGLGIALITIASWVFVIPMGVMDLWTTIGNARYIAAIVCIIAAYIWNFNKNK